MASETFVGMRQALRQQVGCRTIARALMLFRGQQKGRPGPYRPWLFLELLGGKNFRLNGTGGAVAQSVLRLTTVGRALTAIWVLVDAFLIPGWARNQNNLLTAQLGG
jgi:hypothetical protein